MRSKNLCKRIGMLLLAAVVSLVTSAQVWAQQTITGTIVDQTGEPVMGATVLVKGTTNGSTTDLDGRYSIPNVSSNQVLAVSFIGYASQEIPVGNRTVIDITLLEDSELLEDVVVVGYGVQRKSNLTGAISSVKSGDIENRTVVDVNQSLQGKTAGVQMISSSAAPGTESSIRVRGFSSNSTSNPLYVVDGVRVNSIVNIDPSDIESMEVLKDAASAAIYGAEAGNGVILITTKRGAKAEGIGKISYNAQFAIQSLGRKAEVMNADQYLAYNLKSGGIGESLAKEWDGTDINWCDELFETSLMQKHSVNFQNGNDKGNVYISFNYTGNDGIVKTDKDTYKRFAGSVNAEYNIKPWLQISSQNSVTYHAQNSLAENDPYVSVLRAALALDPLTRNTYPENNLPKNMQELLDNGRKLVSDGEGNYYGISKFQLGDDINPYILINTRSQRTWGTFTQGNTALNFKPIKGLVFTSRLGYRFASMFNNIYQAAYYATAARNVQDPTVNQTATQKKYYQWENFANYNMSIAKNDITVMLGTSFSSDRTGTTQTGGTGLQADKPNYAYPSYLSASATSLLHAGDDLTVNKLSYFGRLSYSYDNRYMLQFTMRADAADLSILPEAQRWGYFPAVSAGWTISQEKWFPQDQQFLTNLKLRASWGQNGSIAGLSNFAYANAITSIAGFSFVPGQGNYTTSSLPSSTGNKNLKWETSEQTDFGLDASFFRSRLTFGMDYYVKKTKDLLVSNTLPTLTIGNTVSPVNAGDVENKGWEFDLSWKDQKGDFKYSVTANLATLSNEVTYLDHSIDRINGTSYNGTTVTAFEEGYPVWYFRGYKVDHINPENGNPVFVKADGSLSENAASSDLTMIGSAIPDLTYGLTINFGYKNFDLTVFGQGTSGNDIYCALVKTDRPSTNRLATYYEDAWTAPGQNAKYARMDYQESVYWNSSAVVFDGSYFKIKQIQLGYTLPKNLCKKMHINNLRVYGSLDDFFVFTSYPGLDPEASSGSTTSLGVDLGNFPNSKKLVFGLNFTF